MFSKTAVLALAAANAVSAGRNGRDPGAPLDKPVVEDSLGYLSDGLLNNMAQSPSYSLHEWNNGFIPSECKTLTDGTIESSVNFPATDFQIFDVTYADCGDPWVFCHHKNSNITIDSMASQFGRLPIQMRSWIRHVVDTPADNGWAFEWNGSINFIRPVDDMLATIIHETGHSLDLNGAYADKPLSSSDNWWDNYDQDANVPDNYAKSNMIENVAQNTVVSVYNENVPGQYAGIEPNWNSIFHQYATLITEAREAGDGNSIIWQGEGGTCTHRLPSSDAVAMGTMNAAEAAKKPDTSLKSNVQVIHTDHRVEKHSGCTLTF